MEHFHYTGNPPTKPEKHPIIKMLQPLLANLNLFYHSCTHQAPAPDLESLPNQKLSDARHLTSPSARRLVICLWSTARHSICQPVHLSRLIPQQPQTTPAHVFVSGRVHIRAHATTKAHFPIPILFNETPLWSGQSCVSVIWRQCNTGNRSASCRPVMSIPVCAAPVYNSDGLNRVTQPWHTHLAQNK